VGVAPDAEHVDVRQALGQLGFPEGAVQGLDLVARLDSKAVASGWTFSSSRTRSS